MMTCTSCQEQLLDYVYGLLDEADADSAKALAELRTHLTSCENCQSALVRVQQQQGLLAEASRVPTTITFSKPQVEPRTARLRQRSTSLTAWYVTVATLLFAVLGTIAGGYWWGLENRWKPVELARTELSLRAVHQQQSRFELENLAKKEVLARKLVAEKQIALATLEEQTKQELLTKTHYQEVIAPLSVEANNDTPVVVTNSNLKGDPVSLPEINVALNDARQNRSLTQSYRNPTASNKLNFTLNSVAYADKAGQLFNNDITQDIGKNVLSTRINHPLQVLQADYSAHLCTDKPIYQPGEEVFFRGIALEKATLALPREELFFEFTLHGPDNKQLYKTSRKAQLQLSDTNQPVRDIAGKPLQAVGADSFKLPNNIPLGEARLTLSEKNDRFAAQSVPFVVNTTTKPQFNKQLAFTKASFVPGEKATLAGNIKLPTQQPWGNSNFTYQILIDGKQYNSLGQPSTERIASSTDASGNVKLEFTLPRDISKGQGTLALQLPNGNLVETWTQPFRIETGKLQIDCYPEGGNLIAGVLNHVYFQLRNLAGEAVDGVAELIDSRNEVIETLATFHDETEAKASRGMGQFGFTPKLNEKYQIRMKQPADSQVELRLPAALDSGVTMHVKKSVLAAGESLSLELSNRGQPRELVLSVYCRDVMIALDRVSIPANHTQTILIDTMKPLGGVYRVNVAEKRVVENRTIFQPLAERLIYRHPSQYMSLHLSTVQSAGKPTQLVIDARNEKQEPTAGYLTVVGVNKSLLQMAEASTLRRLPAHFYLAQEVRQPEDLEFADFFLSTHPSAPKALDLLLGVQGWRRFMANPVDANEVAKLQQNTKNDPASLLPISSFDNRQEMLTLALQEAKTQVQTSPLADELKRAREMLEQTQALLKQNQQATSGQGFKDDALPLLRAQLEEREVTWESFTFWFHLLSSCLIAITSLVALGAIILKRTLLPIHLVCTLGVLSLLGIVGAGWLWSKKTSRQPILEMTVKQVAPGNKATVTSPTQTFSQEPGRAVEANLAAPEMAKESKQDRIEESAKPSGNAVTFSQRKLPESNKGEDSSASQEKKTVVKISEDKDATVKSQPATRLQVGGVASNMSNYPGQLASRANRVSNDAQYTNRRTYENRSVQLAQSEDAYSIRSANEKQKQEQRDAPKDIVPGKVSEETNTKDKRPAPGVTSGSGFGGVGAGGRGGMGGGAGSMPPAAATPGSSKTDASASGKLEKAIAPPAPVALGKKLDSEHYFFARQYAWSADARPASIAAARLVWSQTVYWNPLLVVPSSGKYSIPIELPADASIYQFDVFGHDGTGRLGARSIDIKSPELSQSQEPLRLKTKLSHRVARQGDVVQLQCSLENSTSRRQPQAIVRLNIPDGLKLPENMKQLRRAIRSSTLEDVQEPTSFSVNGRELRLVWAELATEQQLDFSIELVCSKTGKYQSNPSQAYFENLQQFASQTPRLEIDINP